MADALRGKLVYKGERGYSAYEVAVLNGFIGTEQDWLATLGTASHFNEDKVIYTATAGQTRFAIPDEYSSNSFIDVYINGLRLNTDEFVLDLETREVVVAFEAVADSKVEIVILTMATNSLPIVTTINETSTDDTAVSAKAVYELSQEIKEDTSKEISDLGTVVGNLSLAIDNKMNFDNIAVVVGSQSGIGSGETVIVDVDYPAGFTQADTVIIGKMISSNNNYYDTDDTTPTASGFPTIKMIALTDSAIRIWLTNTNSTQARAGHFKITLLKTTAY